MISALMGLFSARCAWCKSVEMRSVGVRNSFEQAFSWLLHPYRCALCGRHLFRFRWQEVTEEES
jgi:hypothetical protein